MAATYYIGQDNNIYYNSGDSDAGFQNTGDQFTANGNTLTDKYADYVGQPGSVRNATRVDAPAATGNGGSVLGTNTGGGSYIDTAAVERQRMQASNQRQIDQINTMLGVYAPQKAAGLTSIDSKFNESGRRLGEQRTAANTGYDEQDTQALAGRTRGYEQVDNFANNSANSLNRIFQGANAGNSSVARLLAPKLVGQASDSRRLDVTTSANENIGNIKRARDDATSDFNYADQELENNRGYEKDAFEKGIVQSELEQYGQRQALEQEAGFNTSGSQNEINARAGRLSQLFGAGSFNPSYQARAVAPRAVPLNDLKVDPIQIQTGQNPQQQSSYYSPLLKRKQELSVR